MSGHDDFERLARAGRKVGKEQSREQQAADAAASAATERKLRELEDRKWQRLAPAWPWSINLISYAITAGLLGGTMMGWGLWDMHSKHTLGEVTTPAFWRIASPEHVMAWVCIAVVGVAIAAGLALVIGQRRGRRAGRARYAADQAWAAALPFPLRGYPDALASNWDGWTICAVYQRHPPDVTDAARGIHRDLQVERVHDQVTFSIEDPRDVPEERRGLIYRDLTRRTVDDVLVALRDDYPVAQVTVAMK